MDKKSLDNLIENDIARRGDIAGQDGGMFERLDCVVVKEPSNLFYFSKYSNQDAIILLTPKDKYYLTDARYLQEAEELLDKSFCIIDTEGSLINAVTTLIKQNKFSKIGIEQQDISYNFFRQITKALDGCSFSDISMEIKEKRSIKTDQEIEYINKAQQITDKTFLEVLPLIKEGMTELELGHILYNLLIQNGAEKPAFESIVAFGENSAKPHALKTDRKLKNGDFIKIDFGAKYKGYCADMTRTVAFGKVNNKQREIYEIVKYAQQTALDNIFASVSCKDAYECANQCFKKHNIEKYFLHSLGHGVGTDVHELPYLSPSSNQILQENMVVSVEPGLYFANEFGVRIEDIVLVKKNTAENLTKSEKELIIL